MLRVGMIGGMSWESSALYYKLLNEGVAARLGGLHSAECILYSVDFADIEAMQTAGRWSDAAQVLRAAGRALESAGVDFALLCTNTMHKVYDELQEAVRIPVLHLGDATADAVLDAGVENVGLLGTGFTMGEAFYRDRLARHDLRVLVPSEEDRRTVHDIIYDELCQGIVRPESRQAYRDVISRLVERGVQGVILGCTEIEMLISQEDSVVPVFPTTTIHVDAAIDAALGFLPHGARTSRSS